MDEIYQGNFDKAVYDCIKSSYQYYVLNEETGFSDNYYDYLCRYLLDNFSKITSKYKYLLDEEALRCGSGYHIKEGDYPEEFKS